MRAKFQGTIKSTMRNLDGTTTLMLGFDEGSVTDTFRTGEAKKASLHGTLIVKQVVADELKIGSIITVVVQDGQAD